MINPNSTKTPAMKESKRQRNQNPSHPSDKNDERALRVSDSPQRTDSSDDEMDDPEIQSPRMRDGHSSALCNQDLLLQDRTNRKPPADPGDPADPADPFQQRREVTCLSPFDKVPPFLAEDSDDRVLSFKLYCTPAMQDFLLTFEDPSQRPATIDDHAMNGWLMKMIWRSIF
jgi:hypothetical protein